jgi:hypothetical protein
MPTFNGWTIVTIPSYPPAPQSIQPSLVYIASVNVSPFSGERQVYDWQADWPEFRVNMPPMSIPVFQNWIAFLKNLKGITCVFQFTTAFGAAYPNDIPSGAYFCLKENTVTYSLNQNRSYSLSFEVRQAF